MIEDFWFQVREYWVVIAGLAYAIFYIKKVRDEAVLRNRLSAIRDCLGIFAELRAWR